jgi:hypothetical protein
LEWLPSGLNLQLVNSIPKFVNKSHFVVNGVLPAAVTNAANFWDKAPWSPYVIRRVGGTYHHLQIRESTEQETSVQQVTLLDASFLIGCFYTLKMMVIPSSEMSAHIRTTRCYIPDDKKQKQTPWPLVRKRTIPTGRPPLVDEI